MNNKELDSYDYTDSITNFMMLIKDHTARQVAMDLWKYYPSECKILLPALMQTQHTKAVPALLRS